MAYKRFESNSDLPPPGLPEHQRFDMKGMVQEQILKGVTSPTDLANDVAAFANASGGVLVIGAVEKPPGTLGSYRTMQLAEALQVEEAFRRARVECSPQPVIDVRRIERPPGSNTFVIAVNCDPYLAPPIGVRSPDEDGGEKHWSFPVRRGVDTRHLRPEELGTIMEPRLRRIALQLDEIFRSPAAISLFFASSKRNALIVRVSHESSAVQVKDTRSSAEFSIPLEAISMIWADVGGGWCAAVLGEFSELQFRPPRQPR